jgi:hypothetical protein
LLVSSDRTLLCTAVDLIDNLQTLFQCSVVSRREMHENTSEIRNLKTDISNAPVDQEITLGNFAKYVRLDSVHQLTRSISAAETAALGLNSTQNQKGVSRAFTSIGRVSEKIAEIKLAKQFGDPWSKSMKVRTFAELNEFAGQLISASSWEQHDAASLVIA